MRALCDANLFISFLLSRARTRSAMGAILQAAAEGVFTLLFTGQIADEIRATIADRADLRSRIAAREVDSLLRGVRSVAEAIPRLGGVLPRVGRDPDDDYLIAHAIAANADYLVTWDKDLLDLGQVDGVRIVTPPGFLRVLREEGRLAE
jgi:putative PIN family toxin of toxin-antitoxin system